MLLAVMGLVAAAIVALPNGAAADQASQPSSPVAGRVAAGMFHTCAVLDATVRCWGYGGDGALGYGNTATIGDDETPGSAGPVDVGAGRSVTAIAAGSFHTCALLDDATVRCWGFGGDGRLGYANTASVGDIQTPASAGPVELGPGRTARAISAGGAHTCAVLDDATVRCWGAGFDGRLGYGNTDSAGDVRTPGSAGPVNLGGPARAISAGGAHTCAVLVDNSVRCWGFGGSGRLGYANIDNVGDTPTTTPSTAGPLDLGPGRTATAISAGGDHTCAVLDNGSVRCWGFGGSGRLGYANTDNVGAVQTPGSVGPVDLGPARTATAISAGGDHTCAVLDNGSVRCWGAGAFGQLGYANADPVGDVQAPGSVGPVDLGPARTATALATGDLHTCALLGDTSARCWGAVANGRLGYCSLRTIGDDETPGSVGPVDLSTSNAGCASSVPGAGVPSATFPDGSGSPLPPSAEPALNGRLADALRREAERARRLRSCLRTTARRPKRLRAGARTACLRTFGRTPGRPTGLSAQAISSSSIALGFVAPGSDGNRLPAAHSYLVKQSRRPIRNRREFLRAPTLCRGACRFAVTAVGARIELSITDLRPHSTHYYAVAARDNVSHKRGPRSRTLRIRTR